MGKRKFKLEDKKQQVRESKWKKQEESSFRTHEAALSFRDSLDKRLLADGKTSDKDFRLRIRRKKSTKGFRVVIYAPVRVAPRKEKNDGQTRGDSKSGQPS